VTAAAFFDLDKTIIAGSSTLAFAGHLRGAGFLSRRSLVKAAIGRSYYMMFGADHDQLEKIRRQLGELTRGWSQDEIRQLIRETVDEVVAPNVYAEALFLIDDHHRNGRPVIIVSSSPVEIVEPLGEFLGADEVAATVPEVDEDGRYTGRLEFYAYAEGKADAMRVLADQRQLELADSFAYSDSLTDLPMLEAVGNPVAVNPERALKQVAIERGWPILDFERAVTLRSRVDAIPPPAWSGAALATGIAAGLAVWLLRARRRAV